MQTQWKDVVTKPFFLKAHLYAKNCNDQAINSGDIAGQNRHVSARTDVVII